MTLFRIIEDQVVRHIKENGLKDDPDTRILVLHKLKDRVEDDEALSTEDRFKTVQAINSELCVQRVRNHLNQLDLF